ncbi:MAG TPA: DM13 domain-containing protein [Gemmatimonadales bacterium]
MTTRKSIFVSAAVVGVAVLWYLFRPDALVISKTVSEPLPTENHSMSARPENPGMTMSASTMTDSPAMAHSGPTPAGPVQLTSGRFHKNAHETTGAATIYRLADGRLVLRLTEFATSNGPDVRVYLVAAEDVQDEAAAKRAGFVDLGALKGNIGNQNYDVPAGLDLSRYRAVSIWCRRFSVNFGAAPLVATPS